MAYLRLPVGKGPILEDKVATFPGLDLPSELGQVSALLQGLLGAALPGAVVARQAAGRRSRK